MKLPFEYLGLWCMVIGCFLLVEGKGGGGGGGRGGGGSRGFSRGGSKGISRSRAAVVLGGGAAGYAAYRAHKNLKKDRERGDSEGGEGDIGGFENYYDPENLDYKTQESTSYYASEGIGMSAWTLIALILGIIALGTIGWYCCNVFVPVWEDNREMQRRSMRRRNPGMKDDVPLQETPSTATPSP